MWTHHGSGALILKKVLKNFRSIFLCINAEEHIADFFLAQLVSGSHTQILTVTALLFDIVALLATTTTTRPNKLSVPNKHSLCTIFSKFARKYRKDEYERINLWYEVDRNH